MQKGIHSPYPRGAHSLVAELAWRAVITLQHWEVQGRMGKGSSRLYPESSETPYLLLHQGTCWSLCLKHFSLWSQALFSPFRCSDSMLSLQTGLSLTIWPFLAQGLFSIPYQLYCTFITLYLVVYRVFLVGLSVVCLPPCPSLSSMGADCSYALFFPQRAWLGRYSVSFRGLNEWVWYIEKWEAGD